MKSNPSQDPLQRDIREWSNTSEKGQGHNQPKGKSKGEVKGKRNIQEKGTTTRTRLDLRTKMDSTLGDFGIKRQRVEFVGDVQENDDFETPRLDRAAYVLRSKVQQYFNGCDGTAEFVEESLRWV